VRFRRAAGMKPLPIPVKGGSVESTSIRTVARLQCQESIVTICTRSKSHSRPRKLNKKLLQISSAVYKLRAEADNHSRTFYGNNQAVYSFLRYGVPVKIEAGKVTETVRLINWNDPEKNDFAIAEEVTLKGDHERRPDIVLYVNGIAIGVLELKNSRVPIGEGIRQNLSN
jgi:type I site-specific restriction-modification system R (restriction) subunit